eukprot:6031712-Alexandrium_andersonii.AAC.1
MSASTASWLRLVDAVMRAALRLANALASSCVRLDSASNPTSRTSRPANEGNNEGAHSSPR